MTVGAEKLRKFLDRHDPFKRACHFAKEIGAYPATISRIINGHNNPNMETARKIEKYTNGEVRLEDWLLESNSKKSKK